MILFLGLGNPGRKYQKTRHNLGFRILHSLAKRLRVDLKQKRYKALLGRGTIGQRRIILARPLTFMNNSGITAVSLVKNLKILPENLVVICDDIDLPLGKMRIRRKGTSGGHRGLESLIQELGSSEFPRLRVGVGRPLEGVDPREYVLKNFTREENSVIREAIDKAEAALIFLVERGITRAMTKYNA